MPFKLKKKMRTTGNLSYPKWLLFGIMSKAIFVKTTKDYFLIYHVLTFYHIKGHHDSKPTGML